MSRILRNLPWIIRDFSSAWTIRGRRMLRRADALAYIDGDRRPVVVVPGVYESWEFMRIIAVRLNKAGFPVHVVTALGRNVGAIPDAAGLVANYIAEHDLRGVILVTHSKGGLIGKHVMLLNDADGRVTHMVAIAAPFAGSRYARYLPVQSLKAFSPKAETLVMLAENLEVNSRITSIYPEFDGHIPEGSALVGATNVEVPVRGHFRVLIEEVSLEAIESAVSGVG